MPLTATLVRETKFSTTRLRSGYDIDEVDAFLDIVEADVAHYADELQKARDAQTMLRAQCDQLQSRLSAAEANAASAAGAAAAPPADVADLVAGDSEAESVLALAQRTADEIVRFSESRAATVRASVRAMLVEQLRLVDSVDAGYS